MEVARLESNRKVLQSFVATYSALIQHLADFFQELGDDFASLSRQRRLRLDDTWFGIDLIFFHRRLRCLLIIDLKVGKFGLR